MKKTSGGVFCAVLKILLLVGLGFSCPVGRVSGAVVMLTATDAGGTTSFNAAGHWDSLAAPTAGNSYVDSGWVLRSPATNSNYTFAGDSLTISGGGILAYKGNQSGILTVGDLRIDNGTFSAATNFVAVTLNGTVTANSGGAIFEAGSADRAITVNSLITGVGDISVRSSAQAGGNVTFTGNNTYTGNTTVATGADFTLNANAGLKFVIGASGVNNQITGVGTVNLNGNFTFDLSGAGTTVGNSWNIVNNGTLAETFGAPFSVVGFTDMGGNLWEKINGGVTYQFNEATGVLGVMPEPSTWALLVAGLTAVAVLRFPQKKRAG